MRRLRLHPEAAQDLSAGLAYYADRSLVAAERFLGEVDAAFALIREAPERWPLYRHDTRRFVLPAFPFSIVYRITHTEIHVYAVAHAKRRPGFWRRRRL